eukprot:scaffold4879_cov36-Phaeocystis_antarctica.AAC.1
MTAMWGGRLLPPSKARGVKGASVRVSEVEDAQLGRLVFLVHRHRELLAEYVLDAARVHAELLRQHGVQLLHLALQRANLVLERAGHAFLLGAPPLSCTERGIHPSTWRPVDHSCLAKAGWNEAVPCPHEAEGGRSWAWPPQR